MIYLFYLYETQNLCLVLINFKILTLAGLSQMVELSGTYPIKSDIICTITNWLKILELSFKKIMNGWIEF